MKKLLQNRVAESRLALPVMMVVGIGCWVLAGAVTQMWWLQLGCWIVSSFLMMEINNANVLIRVYSRMISCVFIALTCCASFLFSSVTCGITGMCVCATWLLLFRSYQDKQASGWTFYAFVCLGAASLAFPQILFYVPLLWLLMASNLQSLSWRTLSASLLGLLLPYWIGGCWLVWTGDFTPLVSHLDQLTTFRFPIRYSIIGTGRQAVIGFSLLMAVIGTIHFMRQKSNDKMRVRQLYGFFFWMSAATLLFILLQPQHADSLLPILIINTSPLAGHFFSLSAGRVPNAIFVLASISALLITLYNLWNTSFTF